MCSNGMFLAFRNWLIFFPRRCRLFSDQGMTFAFDNRAKSGFARGEGVGVLVIKPLQRAVADNDRIRSVIVNTGIGQDGRTVGEFQARILHLQTGL